MSINEQILSAIDILVDNKIAKLKYDKTVTATIWSIVNLDTGEYKVKYSGNIFSAFANDLKEQYKVKDTVYVTIPEGDLSNRKVIMGKTNGSSLSYGEMVDLTNSIVEKSPSFDTFYGYKTEEYGVIAGAPPYNPDSQDIVYQDTRDGYHGLFQQYANNYELIRIKASFLTRFHCQHTHGNYGLEVVFFAKEGGEVAYRLDLESFNGDPYNLSVYSPQFVVVKAQKNYLTGIKSIRLFEENFAYDKYVESGLVTDKDNTTEPNIFVKDISIQYVEQRDLTNNLYYLEIAAPQGCAFTPTSTKLDLVGRLIYQSENIMNEKTCVCKWFKRDLSVLIGNDLYDKNAGVGWTPVSQAEFDTVTLYPQDVIHQQKYKLVVIYNENVVLTDEIEIVKLNSGYNYAIAQKTAGDVITLELENNENSSILVGDWYYSYPDGSYNMVKEGTEKHSIEVQDYLTYAFVNFYCAVYSYNKSEIVGTIEWTINSSSSDEDVIISYNGEDTFRYDANGDVAITDAEKERTLQVVLTWKDNTATSYKVEWTAPDGQIISRDQLKPTQISYSMIDNLWIDNDNILHYNIKQKYKNNYNNNTIIVTIKTVDEHVYTFQKEILFLKDGDQGTNGTTYVTAIRPYNTATKLKESGFKPLIYRNGWIGQLPVKCFVYKDGVEIFNSANFDISYKWSAENVTMSTADGANTATLRGNAQTLSNPAYVKVQTTISDKMNGRKYDVYCSYPIDVAVGFSDSEIQSIHIEDIPSYIKYTASGVNPQFYNSPIKFLVGASDRTSTLQSLTKNILDIEARDGGRYLKPASSFIFETNTMARLRGDYSSSKYIYHSIILYLDTYGNEAINGWDGTKLELDENGQYIFAPQVGAGVKDSFNRFTGVVMGKDNVNDKIGLYGYQHGVNTFGLMENGIAYFGAKSGGGQIVIDGTTAKIYGGGQYPAGSGQQLVGGDAENGMTITLANLKPTANTYAIKVGAGKFGVKYDGTMEATGADIEGTIYALKGKIGGSKTNSKGWTIDEDRLWSGSGTYHVELNSKEGTDFAIWAGNNSPGTAYNKASTDKTKSKITSPAKFVVTRDGYVHMNEAYIKGSIYADYITANDGGQVGGWTITKKGLFGLNNKIGLSSTGNYRLWVNADNGTIDNDPSFTGSSYFWVNNRGKLSCKDAEVRGAIYAEKGQIGGWYITSSRIQNDETNPTVYLNKNGSARFGNFTITSGGSLRLSNGNTNTEGELEGDSEDTGVQFSVSRNGHLYCKSANIEGKLRAESLYLTNDKTHGSQYSNILGKNDKGNNSIMGDYLNCKGIKVNGSYQNQYGQWVSGTTFEVDSYGNVTIRGDVHMGPGSTLSWNNIIDGDSQLSNALYPLETAITQIGNDLDDLDYSLSENMGYVDDFVRKFGYTSISAIGINTPVLNAGWITAGKLDANRIDVKDVIRLGTNSAISTTGADTAASAIDISAEAVRITGYYGDAFIKAGGAHIQCHADSGYVTIPKLQVGGVDIADLDERVRALENA